MRKYLKSQFYPIENKRKAIENAIKKKTTDT